MIVEDHTLLRSGLRALLAQDPDLEVIGEADNGRDALRIIPTVAPHVVLMDLSMPGMNGVEAIGQIKRRAPGIRIVVLTMHKSEEYVHEALSAGADGYVLKDATQEELRTAIRAVMAGKTFLSPDVSGRVISGYLGGSRIVPGSRPSDSLSHRERQVLKLIAEGRPNRHIAEYLNLSVKTVEKHRANLMRKLDLHNVASLTAFAIEAGLVIASQGSDRGEDPPERQ